MIRMAYSSFEFPLSNIERDTTPMELTKGGLKPIWIAEHLTLNLRFLGTGESFQSLSLQFRISKLATSYIVQNVCRAVLANLACTHLKVPSTKSEWMKFAKQFMIAGIFQIFLLLWMESIWPSKILLVVVRFTIITSTHILLFF